MSPSRAFKTTVAVLLATTLLAACGGSETVVREPAELKRIENQRLITDVLWKTDTGDGAGDYVTGYTLSTDGRRLFTASRDGHITALELETGKRAWRSDTGKRVISGPNVGQGLVVAGTRDGQVIALSAEDGSELWKADTTGEVLAPPVVASDQVIVYSQDGRLGGFDTRDGKRRWTAQRSIPTLTLRGNATPVLVDDLVIAGLDNGRVIALDTDTGELRWEQLVSAPSGRSELERAVDIDAELLLVEDELYAASLGGAVASLASATGRIRWKRDITTRSGFSFDRDQVFTSDVESTIWALDRSSGAVGWSNKELELRGASAPAMWKGYVVVGDYQGYLHWMIPEDGTIIARTRPLRHAIRVAPLVLDGKIYVLSAEGDVAAVSAEFPPLEEESEDGEIDAEFDF